MSGWRRARFFPEESGRLLTAFLERFFERYVALRFHRRSRGRARRDFGRAARLAAGARGILARLQAEDRRGDGAEAVRDHRSARRVPAPYLFPDKGDGGDPRLCPLCGEGRLGAARRPLRRVRRLLELSRLQVHPPLRRRTARAADSGPQVLGRTPRPARRSPASSGRFGPYVQLGEGKDAQRASIPRTCPPISISNGAAAAVAAARGRRPSRKRQADHRQHRPLRPLSRP